MAVVAIIVVAALAATGTLQRKGSASAAGGGNGSASGLAPVTRQDLSAQTEVNATLGYQGSYTVINQAQGTYTHLPSAGQVITPGQVLYQVNGSPVVLLRGSTPAYRSLSEGTYASDMTGADVAELNADLVALGYATRSEIPAGSDEFTWQTEQAVERLQAHLGVEQTGTLALGQVVFLPAAVRVTAASATPGAPAQPGQPALTGTSTARAVTIPLDAAQQSLVKAGDKVIITLPDNQTTPGVISSVGKVATTPQGGGATDHQRPGHADGPGRHRQPRPGRGRGHHHHRHGAERAGRAGRRSAGAHRRRLRRRGGRPRRGASPRPGHPGALR